MFPCYLAVDIGASSGRHILGHLENGRLFLEEIYRFPNGAKHKSNALCWDYDALFGHILEGMRRCNAAGKSPVSMGVDTWGVDYVLLDKSGHRLGESFCYRDGRTEGMDTCVSMLVDENTLYSHTGIQKQPFNTVYQLMAGRELMPQAERLLMVPDYFHYLLTGISVQEYTNATTTGLVNAKNRVWDEALLNCLSYPQRLFAPLARPGSILGPLRPELAERTGLSCRVVLPPTHDTAAAVLGAPLRGEDCLFLSSGTWSLLGAELQSPITTEASRRANCTNEGGYGDTYRYLKNIMGLWMIQEVQRELGEEYTFPRLAALAEEVHDFPSIIDVKSPRYLAPDSMISAICAECRETDQPIPNTPGELAQTVYHSLACGYAAAVRELSSLTGKTFSQIALVGGGSQNRWLNRLTARETGLTIYAGPAEGTALGNLVCQMLTAGALRNANHARQVIQNSFIIEEVQP